MTEHPSLDVIIPAARAVGSIGQAIDAVLAQGYPNLGAVIVAAHDEPTSAEAALHGAVVVPNPGGTTPVGLNLALARSTADVVARIDSHSTIPAGYLERAVRTLVETNADNVGGMQVPTGDHGWEKAIAAAMSSPFGAGDARYRIGGEPGPTDTVYLGVFRRETLSRLGGYDETFERNQDYELNQRIRETGGVVWFDPGLRVIYRPRGSLPALARQYFQYGQWKRHFSRRHPGSLRWRQLAPPMLVTLLAISALAGFWWPWAWIVPTGYVLGLLLVGLASLPRLGLAALGMPLALATMHLGWGLGFILGRSRRNRKT
ncbi:MAG: glycosyltransferase family 2 protein [Acidimicrobiia bacterium]